MIETYNVTAFTYLARQDGNQNDMVKAYEVYLSVDGNNWGTAVASGEFSNTTSEQVAQLKTPTLGRYLKFVAKSEINNNAWTSAAEIGIKAESADTGTRQLGNAKDGQNVVVYDLQGRRTKASAAKKGIFIQNKKKVVL